MTSSLQYAIIIPESEETQMEKKNQNRETWAPRPIKELPIFKVRIIDKDNKRWHLEIYSPDPNGLYWWRQWNRNYSKCYPHDFSLGEVLLALQQFTIETKLTWEQIKTRLNNYNTPANYDKWWAIHYTNNSN